MTGLLTALCQYGAQTNAYSGLSNHGRKYPTVLENGSTSSGSLMPNCSPIYERLATTRRQSSG